MNSKTVLWVVVGLVVVIVLGLLVFRGERSTTEENGDEMEEAARTQVVFLVGQNEFEEEGTATLGDLGDGRTRVAINVTSSVNNPQPAHIHSGSCEDLGGVVYPLEDVVEGTSLTVVDVSLDDLTEGEFAINLHKSAEEVTIYTSCGNI